MKINLYMDVFRGQREYFYATSNPSAKIDGMRRYQITVEIPDPIEVDETAPVISQTEVDK